MKKSRMYTRKCLALRWALLALAFLLMVNHLLGICLLLPIQTAHRSADLQGIGRTHLVERRWEPELRATGLLYLMENENALLMTDTHLGLLGWETERGSAVDCTGDDRSTRFGRNSSLNCLDCFVKVSCFTGKNHVIQTSIFFIIAILI